MSYLARSSSMAAWSGGPRPQDLEQLLEVALVVRGGEAWKNIFAWSSVGLEKAWGQPGARR